MHLNPQQQAHCQNNKSVFNIYPDIHYQLIRVLLWYVGANCQLFIHYYRLHWFTDLNDCMFTSMLYYWGIPKLGLLIWKITLACSGFCCHSFPWTNGFCSNISNWWLGPTHHKSIWNYYSKLIVIYQLTHLKPISILPKVTILFPLCIHTSLLQRKFFHWACTHLQSTGHRAVMRWLL